MGAGRPRPSQVQRGTNGFSRSQEPRPRRFNTIPPRHGSMKSTEYGVQLILLILLQIALAHDIQIHPTSVSLYLLARDVIV